MRLKRFNKLVAERVEEYEALSEQISNEENPVTKIRYTRQLGEIEAEIETLERSIRDLFVLLGHLTAIVTWIFIGLTSAFVVRWLQVFWMLSRYEYRVHQTSSQFLFLKKSATPIIRSSCAPS
jgi:hypothetical protein